MVTDLATKTITISMLFKWYRQDFGKTDDDIISWIKSHASSTLIQDLTNFELGMNGQKPNIRYSEYNWNIN